jgi:hypothetical protein
MFALPGKSRYVAPVAKAIITGSHPKGHDVRNSTCYLSILFLLVVLFSCTSPKSSPPLPVNTDPNRCNYSNIGAATDLAYDENLRDDRLVVVDGLADPRALIQQDKTTGQTFYVAKVLGTQQRLFYIKQLAPDERPGIASVFKGHLVRWDRLPEQSAATIAHALNREYGITVIPSSTFAIIAEEKPDGCP